MSKTLDIFVVLFFAVAVLSLGASVFTGGNEELARNCRHATRMGVFIALILIYLKFVLA